LDAGWVFDFIETPNGTERTGLQGIGTARERLALFITALALTLLFLSGRSVVSLDVLAGIACALVGANLTWWRLRFESLEPVGELRKLQSQITAADDRQKIARRAFTEAQGTLESLRASHSTEEKRATEERLVIAKRERAEADRLSQDANSRLRALQTQRIGFAKQESDALKQIALSLGNRRHGLNQQVIDIDAKWKGELQSRLAALQKEFTRKYLESFPIEVMHVAGISPNLKTVLRNAGIKTAADLSWVRVGNVRGFGSKRTSAVIEWHRALEDAGRRNSPASLSAPEQQQIDKKYSQDKAALTAQLSAIDNDIKTEESRIHGQYRSLMEPVDQQILLTQQQLERSLEGIRTKFAAERQTLEESIRRGLQASSARIREQEGVVYERRAQLLPLQWEIAKLHRQASKVDDIKFLNFVRSILLFRGSGALSK
jgi:hypothetical protein